MKAYAIKDKSTGKYYCVLPDRSFIAWSDSLLMAKLFATEEAARAAYHNEMTGERHPLPPYSTCEVVPVSIEEGAATAVRELVTVLRDVAESHANVWILGEVACGWCGRELLTEDGRPDWDGECDADGCVGVRVRVALRRYDQGEGYGRGEGGGVT